MRIAIVGLAVGCIPKPTPESMPEGTPSMDESTPSDTEPSDSESSDTDDGSPTDAAPGSCAAAWSSPETGVAPDVTRPDTGTYRALNLSLTYALEEDQAVVTLVSLTGRSSVSPGFQGDPYAYSGKFVQLRDVDDQVLYTQNEYYLVEESVEVPGTTGFSNPEICPDDGYILLRDYPNDPAAVWLVFLQERIDGVVDGSPLQEIVRVALP